jgi:DNA-binding PadR family transcriptional regulator
MTTTDHRRLLLLGVLHHVGMHGYGLHAHLSENGLLGIKRPAAYNLLDKMVELGWLDTEQAHEGGRARRVYGLASDGRNALLELLRAQLGGDEPPDFPNLVSLGLIDLLPGEEARRLLLDRRELLTQSLTAWRSGDGEAGEHGGAAGAVLSYVLRVRELELELVEGFLAELDEEGER